MEYRALKGMVRTTIQLSLTLGLSFLIKNDESDLVLDFI